MSAWEAVAKASVSALIGNNARAYRSLLPGQNTDGAEAFAVTLFGLLGGTSSVAIAPATCLSAT